MARWLKLKTRKVDKSERVVTFRELRKILRNFNIELESPRGNYIDVVKYEEKRFKIFSRKEFTAKRLAKIPYPGEGQVVGKSVLKTLRNKCDLSEEHGVDAEMFYREGSSLDDFIQKYRTTLKRLAKT